MVDARQLSRVLDHAAAHDAKVILRGDPDQLKPIGPGDAYRGLLEQHAPARLETISRQAEPWQREASENLAGGRVAPALDAYQQAGRLHVADTRDAARAELLKQYSADRAADPACGQLVLAYRNDDVARLNTGIRDQRLAAGELSGHVTVAGADYAAGDRLVYLKNDHQGREVTNLGRAKGQTTGVKNGTLATLERVKPDRFVACLDDGRRVAFDPGQYDRIAHGYAVTIHKSQGATVDRTYVLADPLMNRNASYVALTRHLEGVQVYTDRQTFADRDQLDRSLSRAPSKDLARDYAAAAIERHAARLAPLWTRSAAAARPGGDGSALPRHPPPPPWRPGDLPAAPSAAPRLSRARSSRSACCAAPPASRSSIPTRVAIRRRATRISCSRGGWPMRRRWSALSWSTISCSGLSGSGCRSRRRVAGEIGGKQGLVGGRHSRPPIARSTGRRWRQ
jgi:hypothetical protein